MFSLSVWKAFSWRDLILWHILFPFLIFTWEKKTIYFLNGHRNHWLCNAVDFWSWSVLHMHTCHIGWRSSLLSSPFREVRQAEDCMPLLPKNIFNDPGCLLLYTPSYMYHMPNVTLRVFWVFFLISFCVVIMVLTHSHTVWVLTRRTKPYTEDVFHDICHIFCIFCH